ncbi:hypothetical protein LAZ67_2001605 [Cordylochernes scorpioides]|uniref:Histone-lysine N-methyltransferase SETMAR n=1 Tax=Cordylochernes scorpioides TaxID=51811 RepID=A0ABY6K1D2_9ARAC|nr:hypothetical protein LAZ67_2001605 [Cordylochernes scorpioides]
MDCESYFPQSGQVVTQLKTKMVLIDGSLRYTGELHCLGMEADTEQPGLRIQENFTGGEHLPEQGLHGSATPIAVSARRWNHRRHSWHVSRQDGAYLSVSMPRQKIHAHYEHMSEFKRSRTIGLKEAEGRQNVHDDERSGSPVTATDNAAVASVRNVVEADRRVTIDEIMIRLPPGIEIRRSSIGTIMSDVLNFLKVCTRWVPRLLLENHKQQQMEAARAFLEMHQRDGDQLFSRIVTGDESWVHHSTPETKRQSMVWKKPEESAPKKAKVTISAGKVMTMENFKWEIFTHPPYSPKLAPSEFHLYPALKWHLGGKHFANDDEVQAEVNHWLRRQDTAWYNSGI